MNIDFENATIEELENIIELCEIKIDEKHFNEIAISEAMEEHHS